MKLYSPCIGGNFTPTEKTFEVKSPYNQQVIAQCSLALSEELEEAILAAQRIEEEMAGMPSYQRQNILNGIANGMERERENLAKILCLEAGKPMKYSLGEVDRAIQTFRVAAEECKRIPAEVISLDWTPAGEGKEGIVKHFPVGIVAGISPFNFPLNLSVHKIAPAIAAGCPIILKPARSTPLSALELARIAYENGLPEGALSVLPMDRTSGNQLVTDERFALLSFTGSPQVGWDMKNQVGKKRVVLELGGNAGVIVTQSSNIELAVNKCVVGAFAYSGQVCIHTQRIYVHEKVFEEFLEKFAAKTRQLKVGDPLEKETDISSMIDETNAIRVEGWVQDAVADGAKIYLGGKREGNYFPPTILTNTKPDMNVCAMEVFGPVVTVEPFTDYNEAIKMVNNSEYGLQAGVFTNQIDEQNLAFQKLKVGGVIINDIPTFRVDHMPYGGIKNSGIGREGVKYAMLDMLEPKLLVRNM